MTTARLRGAALALACLVALAGCGGGSDGGGGGGSDDGGGGDKVNASTDPVEVKVGKAFSWNGYAVEDGWQLKGAKRFAGVDQVTTPEVKGTIRNTLADERAAIFQMVFSTDGAPVATLNCSSAKMAEGQSQEFLCPGLNTTMPGDYDAVVVQEFTR